MTKIYESPDGGKTIFERAIGDYKNKTLIRSQLEYSVLDNTWKEVIAAAKHNQEISDLLDRALVIYQLGKK